MKISHDTIGNQTRDLPPSSAVPPPTAPTLTPEFLESRKRLVVDNEEERMVKPGGSDRGRLQPSKAHGYHTCHLHQR